MSVGEICNRTVVFVNRDGAVADAAALMRRRHVGSLVVVDEHKGGKRVPVGIVTDRDIVIEVMATGLDAGVITVGDIMVRGLVTARESDGLLPTLSVMRKKGVRRIPIVDGEGALVGIVSIDDMIQIMGEHLGALGKIVAREQARETKTRK